MLKVTLISLVTGERIYVLIKIHKWLSKLRLTYDIVRLLLAVYRIHKKAGKTKILFTADDVPSCIVEVENKPFTLIEFESLPMSGQSTETDLVFNN